MSIFTSHIIMLSLGAINKTTGSYVTAKLANKQDKYKCPDPKCGKDVVVCQGKIRAPYFRHFADSVNPCHYYDKPSESQIHKDAKMLMKFLLESKIPFKIKRKCYCCEEDVEFEIPKVTDTSLIQLEHRFDHDGLRIADVAYLDNNDIVCLFEICYKHKTDNEVRPEPWFELDAVSLLTAVNTNTIENQPYVLHCIRSVECEDCADCADCDGTGYTKSGNCIRCNTGDNFRCRYRFTLEKCIACRGTGTSYWSDDCYGPCLECR